MIVQNATYSNAIFTHYEPTFSVYRYPSDIRECPRKHCMQNCIVMSAVFTDKSKKILLRG